MSSVSRVAACGQKDRQTDKQGGNQTDMTKLIVLFALLQTHLKIRNPGFWE
jgi:hypothetical protein